MEHGAAHNDNDNNKIFSIEATHNIHVAVRTIFLKLTPYSFFHPHLVTAMKITFSAIFLALTALVPGKYDFDESALCGTVVLHHLHTFSCLSARLAESHKLRAASSEQIDSKVSLLAFHPL